MSAERGIQLHDPRQTAGLLRRLDPDRSLEVEIGCGNGHFISSYAQSRPGTMFLAVEIKKNGAKKRPVKWPDAD